MKGQSLSLLCIHLAKSTFIPTLAQTSLTALAGTAPPLCGLLQTMPHFTHIPKLRRVSVIPLLIVIVLHFYSFPAVLVYVLANECSTAQLQRQRARA